jgi:hypothetical protein
MTPSKGINGPMPRTPYSSLRLESAYARTHFQKSDILAAEQSDDLRISIVVGFHLPPDFGRVIRFTREPRRTFDDAQAKAEKSTYRSGWTMPLSPPDP